MVGWLETFKIALKIVSRCQRPFEPSRNSPIRKNYVNFKQSKIHNSIAKKKDSHVCRHLFYATAKLQLLIFSRQTRGWTQIKRQKNFCGQVSPEWYRKKKIAIRKCSAFRFRTHWPRIWKICRRQLNQIRKSKILRFLVVSCKWPFMVQ